MAAPLDIVRVVTDYGTFYMRRFVAEIWDAAGRPRLNSAGRWYSDQKYLYDGWRAGEPGFSPADNPDSDQPLAHMRFVSLDIDPTPDRVRRLEAAGMYRPLSYELWHWEPGKQGVNVRDDVRRYPKVTAPLAALTVYSFDEDVMATKEEVVDALLNTRIKVRGGTATVKVQEALSAAFDVYDGLYLAAEGLNGDSIVEVIERIAQDVDEADDPKA